MIFIVPWKEIVGRDFLEDFCLITSEIVKAKNNGQDEAEVWKRHSPEDRENYSKKRHFMRRCGYEMIGKHVFRYHGWYDSFLSGSEVRFAGTANPDNRTFITVSQFLDWKKGFDQASDEEGYYSTKGTVNKVVKSVGVASKRRDVDDEFVPEVAAR